MTANQIAYQANVERERTNRVNELLQSGRNIEEARANRTKELLSWRDLLEQSRANRVKETELARSNIARETETARTNRKIESIKQQEADTKSFHEAGSWIDRAFGALGKLIALI